jgi:hypothetical protein
VFGLQRTERNISLANYAAEMGVSDQVGKLSEEEITVRRNAGKYDWTNSNLTPML